MEMVKNERAEEIDIDKKAEIIRERSSASESEANGELGRYVQTVQGQVRRLQMSLETTYNRRIEEGHDMLP